MIQVLPIFVLYIVFNISDMIRFLPIFVLYLTGEHPRFGALDVCPFIPVSSDITMDDCVACAKRFGERLAREINVPGRVMIGLLLVKSAYSLWRIWRI